MDATDARIDLRLWSVATFRTVTFVVGVALVFHLRGSLHERLAALSTLTGAGLFLGLWMTTLIASLCEVRLLRRAEIDPRRDASPAQATIIAGAIDGVAVFIVLAVAVVSMPALAEADVRTAVARLMLILIVLPIGGVAAVAIGGAIGLGYAIVEFVIARVASGMLRVACNAVSVASPVHSRAPATDRSSTPDAS